MRQLINVNFLFVYLGSFIASIGLCFFISTANKFANVWFPQNQIFLVSSVCIFGILTSQSLGIFLSSFFITKESTKEDIFAFIMWESIIMIIIHLLVVVFFKGKPKNIQK